MNRCAKARSSLRTFPARRGLNWGVSYEIAQKETRWRYDDIATEREAASWTVFAEQRLNERWRLAQASDLGGRGIADSRQRYDGSRDSFPLSEIETAPTARRGADVYSPLIRAVRPAFRRIKSVIAAPAQVALTPRELKLI